MAKKKFDNGNSAIAELTKTSQASLQKLPPDARILGFAMLAIAICGVLLVTCLPTDEKKMKVVQDSVHALLTYSLIAMVVYILGRVLFHWMSLWEKIQLLKLQNEVTNSTRGEQSDG